MVDRSGQAFEINQYQNIDTSPMESAAACSCANAPVAASSRLVHELDGKRRAVHRGGF